MKTVILGSGNVAYHMATALQSSGITVDAVWSRNTGATTQMAEELGLSASTGEIPEADFYLICVSDQAVAEVSARIKKENCLVAHVSGSLPKEILEGPYRKASFYPLQTFTRDKPLNYRTIPIFVEAEHEQDLDFLLHIACAISERAEVSDYEKRKYIHLTAVFACNFTNHLFARAKEISESQGISFDYFLPLIDETVSKIHTVDPQKAQTGPAVRGDMRVLELHRKLISHEEQLRIYDTLNASIQKMYKK